MHRDGIGGADAVTVRCYRTHVRCASQMTSAALRCALSVVLSAISSLGSNDLIWAARIRKVAHGATSADVSAGIRPPGSISIQRDLDGFLERAAGGDTVIVGQRAATGVGEVGEAGQSAAAAPTS